VTWAWDNRDPLSRMLSEHIYMAFLPLVFGLVVAIPLGVLMARSPRSRTSALGLCALVEAIPALSWFVFLPGFLGTALSARANVVVGLTLLVAFMLTRTIANALAEVPEDLVQTAEALGFTSSGRTWQVDLPVAMPAIIDGLRAAAVATISLTTLAALVGGGGLGLTFTDGYATRSDAEVLSGAAVVVVLVAAVETLLIRTQRLVAPWAKMAAVR
jgi:osmoprotectant transport system permease protein